MKEGGGGWHPLNFETRISFSGLLKDKAKLKVYIFITSTLFPKLFIFSFF